MEEQLQFKLEGYAEIADSLPEMLGKLSLIEPEAISLNRWDSLGDYTERSE